MFTNYIHIFKIKRKLIQAKCLSSIDVNQEYLSELNKTKFLINQNKKLEKQINYIKRIKKSKNKILIDFFFKKKLIGTSGFQKINTNKPTVGIFIFDKNFLGKKLSHLLTANSCVFLHKILKKNKFRCGISNKNISSIKMFKKIGFNPYYKKNDVTFYKSNIEQIKKSCI